MMMLFSLLSVSSLNQVKLLLLLLSLLLSHTHCLSFPTIMYQLFTTSSSSSTGINKNNSIKSNMKNLINTTTTTNDNLNNIDIADSSIDSTHPLITDRSYLHITEYPNDNYNHIYGYNDNNHLLSKLQAISKLRIEDTIRNKKPIDTVSYFLLF